MRNKPIGTKRAMSQSLLVGLLLVMLVAAPVSAEAPEAALTPVDVYTVDPIGLVGGKTVVQVRIGHVGYLSSYQFHLHFDPDVLQVEDAVPSLPGVQIGDGDVFDGKQPFATHQVDNGSGEIVFSNTIIGVGGFVTIPAPNTASLADITFRIVGPGTSPLTFDPSSGANNLSDRSALPIAAEWTDGSLQGVVPSEHLYIPLVANNWR